MIEGTGLAWPWVSASSFLGAEKNLPHFPEAGGRSYPLPRGRPQRRETNISNSPNNWSPMLYGLSLYGLGLGLAGREKRGIGGLSPGSRGPA